MDNYILQKILFPTNIDIDEQQLYFKYLGNGAIIENNSLQIAAGTELDFGTYFNSFSLEKWKAYSSVEHYKLSLKILGEGQITVYHAYLDGGTVRIDDIQVSSFSNNVDNIDFQLPDINKGLIGFKIITKDSAAVLQEGFYYTDKVETADVRIALAFTTYKREKYIKENIRRILNYDDERLDVFVVDNGNTLNLKETPRLKVISNINAGGAGGFARNMIEIINSSKAFTHVVLMDDDVILDPNIFDRLLRFISVIKPEFANAFIGGAMFRCDYKAIHVESGAKWKGTVVWPYGNGMDMRRLDALLHTNSIHKEDYNAWWFCCIPIDCIRDDNLPLPLFFQWDDIDYGVRNKTSLILLNGLCLWHEPFESKRSAMYTYYSTRNPLIVNCCHKGGNSKRQVLQELKRKILAEICLYRYEHAQAIITAIEDFLKGPQWLCSINPDEYNKIILKLNRPMEYIANYVDYQWYLVGNQIQDCDLLHHIVRVLSFNGYLLKANREIILPLYADRPVQGYRASRILFYEINKGTGFWAKKDIKTAFICLNRFLKLYILMNIKYNSISKSYREHYRYMTSRAMWEKYLQL